MSEAKEMNPGGKPVHAASASASAKIEPSREVSYAMPSAINTTNAEAAPPPVALAPSTVAAPTEIIERPQPHTLARGRYEAKPAIIWAVSAGAVVFLLGWVMMRVRRVQREKRRAAELRRALPRVSSAS